MKNYAVIENDKVINVIVTSPGYTHPDGLDLIDTETTPIGIGWERIDGEWVNPNAEEVNE